MKKIAIVLFFLFTLWPLTACAKEIRSNGEANASWIAPTAYEDGSPIIGILTYNLYYGTLSDSYSKVVEVGTATNFSITLPAGEYYFAVTALDSELDESKKSNEDSHIFVDMVIIMIPDIPTFLNVTTQIIN